MDVNSFYFFVLTEFSEDFGYRPVGFFSKVSSYPCEPSLKSSPLRKLSVVVSTISLVSVSFLPISRRVTESFSSISVSDSNGTKGEGYCRLCDVSMGRSEGRTRETSLTPGSSHLQYLLEEVRECVK